MLLLLKATFSLAADIEVINSQCYERILSDMEISSEDVKNYEKVFEFIQKGRFDKADKRIKEIKSNVLMGHVLAEKYLSAGYNSNFRELKSWLENYHDHPQAWKILNLLRRKKGKNDIMPDLEALGLVYKQKYYSPYSWFNEDYTLTQPQNAKYLRQKVNEFRGYLNKGTTKRARLLLENATFRKIMPNKNYDVMSGTLALVYFLDNEDVLAAKWAEKASRRSKDETATWIGGLASYRMKKYKNALAFFEKLGDLEGGDEWLKAAGAYWAYRSYDKLGNGDKALVWLKKASQSPRTFYGILANYKLGQEIEYNWKTEAYLNDFTKDDYIEGIMSSTSMKRAILLLKAKNKDLAFQEIRGFYKNMPDNQQEVALFIAKQYKMHYLGIEISNHLRNSGKVYDEIAYPLPDWKPKGGWKVDKALVWGLVRQESAFWPTVKSGAGAIGLMQLMPDTAYHVTKVRDNKALHNIGRNLEVGQMYMNYLSEKPFIEGNLFFLTMAYNAGPGNLLKWQKKMKYNNDPLMFIETIPARETRLYVKRVMANYWIYDTRLGNQNQSLEQVANNQWPTRVRTY